MTESPPPGLRTVAVSLLLLIGCALLVRVPLLSQAPMMDELYHLFAAKSWLAEGELAIADGVYTRAAGYTKLVALGFGLFGEHIEVLRLIGVLAATLSIIALFFWTRATAGALAAWLAALIFCFWPDGISVSIHHRFYAPHGLLFLLGALGIYLVVEKWDWWERWTLITTAIVSALMFALALALQKTTLIGLGGVGLWLAAVRGRPWFLCLTPIQRKHAVLAIGAASLLMLAVLMLSGIGSSLLDAFRWTPDWAAAAKNQFWYYHAFLTLYYPTFWSLTAIATVIALAFRPRPVGFCLAIFIPAFILHSLGGMKHMRYLYYVMPFLFVVWGIALAQLLERFWPFFKDALDRSLDHLVPNLPRRPLRIGLIGAVLAFTLMANGASIKTLALVAGVTVPPMAKPAEWQTARDALEPWLDEAVLITTSEMETLYTFDRYDMLISNSRMSELERSSETLRGNSETGEFSVDWRTGRPVVSEPASVALIMACFEKGVIVSNVYRWRFGPQLDDEVADLIETTAIKVDLPAASMMTAFRWDHEIAEPPAACAELSANHPAPPLSGMRTAQQTRSPDDTIAAAVSARD